MEPVLLVIPNAGLSIVALTMAFESSDRGPCYGDIITTYLPVIMLRTLRFIDTF